MIRRVALALATAILPLTLLVFSVVPASAGTGTPCYQSSCNGLDPTTSYNRYTGYECNSGASPVPGGSIANVYGGTLEMRWGPDCSVNWTRYTVGTHDQSYVGAHFWISIESSTGVTSYYHFTGQNGVTYYGNEVYSPGPATMCLGFDSTGIPPQPYCWTQPS